MNKEIKSEYTANLALVPAVAKAFKVAVEDNIGKTFHVPAPVRNRVVKPTGFFSWFKA